MKFFRNLLVALVAGFALVGCGGSKDPEPTPADGYTYVDVTVADPALKSIGAGKKVYVTTLGQKNLTLCEGIVEETGVTIEASNNLLAATDVEEGSTVIAVIGYTAKGAAASIPLATETARVDAFVADAQAGKINLVAIFLEGEACRGNNTDKFLQKVLPVSKVALVWDDLSEFGANFDGKFLTFAGNTPVYAFADEYDMVPSLEYILK